MEVMTGFKTIKTETKTLTLMGVNKPTHILIDDHKTKCDSNMVKIEDIKKLLEK